MRLTRTHALYWVKHKMPAELYQALAKHTPVSIDLCINAHAETDPIPKPHSSVWSMYDRRQVAGEAAMVAYVLERSAGLDTYPPETASNGREYLRRWEADYRKWARKILKGRNK